MNEAIKKVMQRWQQLQPREQQVLGGGLLFLMLFTLYAGIWAPAVNTIDKLQSGIPKKQAQLAQMRLQSDAIKRSGNKRSAKASGTMLSRVERISREKSLSDSIGTMEPQGESGVRLVISEIEFSRLLDYINALTAQAMDIESATLDAGDSPGIVSARIVLNGK
ncbi:MAG: type II secretion system protein M [Proteobacteria bacterium]|nr:type II secretion system protein M [Pseudomonadota bacterium]